MKIGEIWNDIYPYILQILLGAVALFGLIKDWEDYGEKFGRFKHLRWILLASTIAVIGLTLYDTHSSRRETRQKEQAAEKTAAENRAQIDTLTQQITLERDENQTDADGFRKSFDSLYQKYSDLAAKTQNKELIQELGDTKKQLKEAENKFEQPKAKLTVSFWRADIDEKTLSGQLSTQLKPDGSISFDLIVGNLGDAAAIDGGYTVRICNECKYQKEPEGFTHISGSSEKDRQYMFTRLNPHSMALRQTFEIIPPIGVQEIEIGFLFTCTNCIRTDEKQILKIHYQ